VVIGLELGADLHMAQLMPLPLTVSCFSKIQIGFTFLVPAHPGSPRKRAIKRMCVCVYNSYMIPFFHFAVIQHSTDGCSVLPWLSVHWLLMLNACLLATSNDGLAFLHLKFERQL